MSQSNIYAQKENGDLRLVAEIEGESDPALAVDALLDEMPRLKQRQFVVIDLDNVMVVEAEDEIVQPRRKITVTNSNNAGAVVEADEEAEEDEEDEAGEEGDEEQEEPEAEEEEEAPAPPKRRGRPKGKPKPAAKRRPGRPAKRSGRKSSFKANPASAE